MNLYEEIDGDVTIDSVVVDFWRRVNTDAILAPWFADADSHTFTAHLHACLAVILDGPERYQGRSMRNAHAGLEVTGQAFDLLVRRLHEAWIPTGISPEQLARVAAHLTRLRPIIVERES